MNKKKYAVLGPKLDIINLCEHYIHSPHTDIVFESYNINKKGTQIKGMILDYKFEMNGEIINIIDKDISDIDPKELHPKHILGIFKTKKLTYDEGWILLKKRKFATITNPKGFIIYEEDDEENKR
jgi:hypothetical protein